MFEQYISDLLYKYDTVVLPGFGAFILKHIPSSIQQPEQRLTPPAKFTSFYPFNKTNDGILANHISEKEKISFFDAAFVEKINQELAQGKPVRFEKIGTLIKSGDNNFTFTPDTSVNYNIEAWGMEDIEYTPAKEKIKFPKAAIWILSIIVIAGCCTAALFIIKPDLIKKIKPDKIKTAEIINNIPSPDTVKKDTLYKQTKQNIQPDTSKPTASSNFYIILASFRIKENADNYAETLRQKTYNSSVIFLNDKGLYVVSCNSYPSQQAAELALSGIKSENPEAWILMH
jgi:nucleoid DNA-binding protein